MEGKIILNLAISLDGYIASEEGSFDWIVGDGDSSLNTVEGHDFEKFISDVDIVVMGKNCYNQGFAKDFPTKEVFVATSENLANKNNIHFIGGDIIPILELEKSKGRKIFLFGGGSLIDPFIKANGIDEYMIGIIPIILGKGRRLFLDNNPMIQLHLEKYTFETGIPLLWYTRRE